MEETSGTEWIRRFTEEESARFVARELTRTDEAGDLPLAGLSFAIKDNIDIAGVPTTAAFRERAGRPAVGTATAVRRLIQAGAVPAGKTNLDQFATGLVGTRSPYGACHAAGHPTHVSGGSSSGSAVAVASGQVDLALGTDTAGSGRVPAAFNGIVGLKPSRGLISTTGVVPACRSLDCVSIFTRSVDRARAAFRAVAAFDPADPYSRRMPPHRPHLAATPGVIAVPAGALDLDAEHRTAWDAALRHAREVADYLVEVDIEPFLEAARLLYQGPWLAERWHAIAPILGEPGLDHPDLDPTVRRVLAGAEAIGGAATFAGFDELARLRRATEHVWDVADALLLPVTPGHPTLAEVAADPVGVNGRLGTYTNFVNLLDLCAIAVPAGRRADGLPFGVQLIGPTFADEQLLDLAAAWTGEGRATPESPLPAGFTRIAVVGAHLSGLPLNSQLLTLGAQLIRRTRTAPDYRLYRIPDTEPPRPGLYPIGEAEPPEDGRGIPAEIWQLTQQSAAALLGTVPPPLGFAAVTMADGTRVLGFIAHGPVPAGAVDVTGLGGWRPYLDTVAS
ncbi:allophanate hydrolase [Actinospica robiniae]|uniref:allophanate hydrolase n=1 Tax=Actinospica robiniae TaxID=304901 RepID=UPI0003FAD130|nr:allophanate hydrolase [Actinospica robiniae]